MAPSITANPNPVGVYGPTASGTTTIRWDTDSSTVNGKLYVLPNADPSLRQQIGGGNNGSRRGEVRDFPVTMGTNYLLLLESAQAPIRTLAVLAVRVEDLLQQILDSTLDALTGRYQLDPPQLITRLMVTPSVDTVAVRFTTSLPTVPTVEVETLQGVRLVQVIPLLAGLQTKHRMVLGVPDPGLPQGTDLRLRVKVPGRQRFGGPPREVVRTAVFTTGTRFVEVSFDTLTVHTDGDPGIKGAGEFSFSFVAGDASEAFDFLAPLLKADISAGDPPIALNRSVVVDPRDGIGPRRIYVKASAKEWDISPPWEWGGLNVVGSFGERRTGSWATEDGDGVDARIGNVFDISEAPPGYSELPFQMRTGDFAVAFTVTGRIQTIVRPGRASYDLSRRISDPANQSTLLGRAGSVRGLAPIGGNTMLWVALGADRTVHIQTPQGSRRATSQGWRPLAPDPGGAVTAVLDDGGNLHLLALSAEGDVQRWHERGREWRSLGRSAALPAVAAPLRGRGIRLWCAAADGTLWEGDMVDEDSPSPRWQAVAEQVFHELQAVAIGESVVLLALSRERRLRLGFLHAPSSEQASRLEWRELGGPQPGWFTAIPAPQEMGGLVVSVLTDQLELSTCHLPDLRNGEEARWQTLGGIEELVVPVREPAQEQKQPPLTHRSRSAPASGHP